MTRPARWLLLLVVLLLAGCGGGAATTSTHSGIVAPLPVCVHGYATPYGCQPHSPTFGLPPKGIHAPAPLIAPQTLEQFDSVIVSTVPPHPQAVAGYVGGSWPTFGPLSQAFPLAKHISIAVNAGEVANCLDIEPGDAVPSQAADWVRWMLSLHEWKPCLYTSLSEMPAVRDALAAGGISRATVRLWDADWTFFAHLDPGYDCTQWTDHALNRNLDESTCALTFYPPTGPSPALVKHYQQTRNSALRTYRRLHCPSSAVGAPYKCKVAGAYVLLGVRWLDKHHVQKTPQCWGRHAQLSAAACQIVRPNVSAWSHARSATNVAQVRNGCFGPINFPVPSHTPICNKLRQRYRYFQARIDQALKEF